jgi:hypothetical protein
LALLGELDLAMLELTTYQRPKLTTLWKSKLTIHQRLELAALGKSKLTTHRDLS